MIREIQLDGKTVVRTDTPDDAALRARLVNEITEIASKGGTVDIPPELP